MYTKGRKLNGQRARVCDKVVDLVRYIHTSDNWWKGSSYQHSTEEVWGSVVEDETPVDLLTVYRFSVEYLTTSTSS